MEGNKKKMIYLDSNIFIYSALDCGETGKNAELLLNLLESGKFSACTASLTFDEVVWVVAKETTKEEAIQSCKAILNLRNLKILSVDRATIVEGIAVFKNSKLKPRDSIHAAVMNINNIKEIITEDKDFDLADGIKRYSIKDFLRLLK